MGATHQEPCLSPWEILLVQEARAGVRAGSYEWPMCIVTRGFWSLSSISVVGSSNVARGRFCWRGKAKRENPNYDAQITALVGTFISVGYALYPATD